MATHKRKPDALENYRELQRLTDAVESAKSNIEANKTVTATDTQENTKPAPKKSTHEVPSEPEPEQRKEEAFHASSGNGKVKHVRGCRIPEDWTPSEDDIKFAADRGFARPDLTGDDYKPFSFFHRVDQTVQSFLMFRAGEEKFGVRSDVKRFFAEIKEFLVHFNAS